LITGIDKRGDIVTHFEYHKPHTIKEAIDLMGSLENAKFIAGGTDVMVLIRQKKISPAHLISLRNIKGFSSLDTGEGLQIGGGVTHNDIMTSEFIQKHYSALTDAAGKVGSRQIRNVATVSGNICNAAPSADTACPLLVLDADVKIEGPKGARRLPLDDFFLGANRTALAPGELVTGFHLPPFGLNTGSAYIKHTRRQAMELPMVGIAVRVTIRIGGSEVGCKDAFCTIDSISNILRRLEDEELRCEEVRIGMGVVAPRPVRARKAEAALRGKVISEALFEEIGEIAAAEAQPRDSIRGEAWYRREMVKVLTKRAILLAVDRMLRPDDMIHPDRLW
jgi:CO/xanthine dehydrogenase FAD-binding subunit